METVLIETGRAAGMYARGNIELLDGKLVAVEGSRAATAYGTHVAGEIAAQAVAAGHVVVAGGGYGIAAAALRAALAAGGAPVVILAGGLDRPYPTGHSELFDTVLQAGGLLLSTCEDGQVPTRSGFASRNVTMGRMVDAVVIVEAGPRSGAFHVLSGALVADRVIAVVPGPITSASSAGSNHMLASDKVQPLWNVDMVAELV